MLVEIGIAVIGIELSIHRMIIVQGAIASGSHVHHATVHRGLYGLGNRTIFKHRLPQKTEIIHNDVGTGGSERFNGLNHVQTAWKSGVEKQIGTRRQIVNNLGHGAAFVRVVLTVAISAVNDLYVVRQVTRID